MKPVLLILGALLLSITANAQKADTAQILVHYKYSWLRDTTNRDKPYTENMMLVIGKNASVYKSYDRVTSMELMKKDMETQLKAGGPISIHVTGSTSNVEFFQFPNENKLVRKENIVTNYLIDEPIPVIKWIVNSDTLTIGNLHCQKATAHFKGRDYTAWFCEDLNYRTGPWKLNGLPGLIVEAYDSKKQVVFKFDGIEQVEKSGRSSTGDGMLQTPGVKMVIIGADVSASDPHIIALPTNGVKTTEKELANLKEARRKDPNGFLQAQMAGAGMSIKPDANMHTITRFQPAQPVVINNPLELPDGK